MHFFSFYFIFLKQYFWSSLIALLAHSSSGAPGDGNRDASGRQPRQNRGNYKFQVPAYLNPDAYAQTIQSSDYRGPDGSFGYDYHTDNGISAKQSSSGVGADKVVRGYYSYVGSDGVTYTTNYIADRYGYRAYGAHLPIQPHEVYDPTKLPVQPIIKPVYVSSKPAPVSVYPLQSHNQQNHQHHSQTAYYPQPSLQSKPIYVAEPGHYVTITPKPFNNGFRPTPQPQINILPPYNYVASASQYVQPPYAWTTSRPAYDNGYTVTTFRPYA